MIQIWRPGRPMMRDAVLLDRSSAVDIGYPKFPERF
jgi:hypothetical protein